MIFPAARDTDGTTPRRRNSRTAAPRAQKLAGQIDAEDFVPLFQGHVGESGIALQAGIVDENVDRAVLAHGAVEHFLNLVLRRNIGFMRNCIAAGTADFIHHGVRGLVAVNIIHHHISARLAKSDRDALTDAGVGPGNECFLSGQRLVIGHGAALSEMSEDAKSTRERATAATVGGYGRSLNS